MCPRQAIIVRIKDSKSMCLVHGNVFRTMYREIELLCNCELSKYNVTHVYLENSFTIWRLLLS